MASDVPLTRTVGGRRYDVRPIYERIALQEAYAIRLYEAWDPDLGRRVALKEVALLKRSEAGRALLDQARAEARLLARVGEHPNLPLLYDVVEEQDRVWLVMEYVPGKTVAELYLRRERRPPGPEEIQTILDIGGGVCRALQALHRRGIAHRDVAPANIVVSPGGTVKLIDVGLAALPGRTPYQAEGEGTPGYRAPEQTAARDPLTLPGPPSDVYGLAAILYHLLTSTSPPVPLPTRCPPPPSQINPSVPQALDELLLAALAYSPKERPGSGAFCQQLRTVRDSLRMQEERPDQALISLAERYNEEIKQPPPPPPAPPPPRTPRVKLPGEAERARAWRTLLIAGGVLFSCIVALSTCVALATLVVWAVNNLGRGGL